MGRLSRDEGMQGAPGGGGGGEENCRRREGLSSPEGTRQQAAGGHAQSAELERVKRVTKLSASDHFSRFAYCALPLASSPGIVLPSLAQITRRVCPAIWSAVFVAVRLKVPSSSFASPSTFCAAILDVLNDSQHMRCGSRDDPTLKRLLGTDGRWHKASQGRAFCSVEAKIFVEVFHCAGKANMCVAAMSKVHTFATPGSRDVACSLFAGASKAPGSTVESSPVPRQSCASLSPNQAAGNYFRCSLCRSATHIGQSGTPAVTKCPSAPRALCPQTTTDAAIREKQPGPNILTRVMENSEWFTNTENNS
ncbi:hypothetical protein K432DRAFT_395126 [Lepidopterella palustris CBS 459.81]|uniref:Uncharacterized protein n=1 Tax=Lepidopterella palustris CBS 459.81 TaxID=1314670 RepID=A0A8E2E604_9PEZI|nr:hypothetical protein K432DRAFT_395126 [Lepidopterella palustris CBS 459.81]